MMMSEIWWTPAADTVELNDADRATIDRLLERWRASDGSSQTLSSDELRMLNHVWVEICRGHPTRGEAGREFLEASKTELRRKRSPYNSEPFAAGDVPVEWLGMH